MTVSAWNYLHFTCVRRALVDKNSEEYFSTYWEAMWNLYVLVTTANNPDVM